MERVQIIGAGRVGSAIAARLAERGLAVGADGPELVLLCVPDRAIAEVARTVPAGPWLAHTSGATPLAALAPHTRRFGLHPLQTFTLRRGAEQLDGAYAAVSAETHEARDTGFELAAILGLEPFSLDDGRRAAYHAGAAIASNYLVTLYRAASRLFEDAGAHDNWARAEIQPCIGIKLTDYVRNLAPREYLSGSDIVRAAIQRRARQIECGECRADDVFDIDWLLSLIAAGGHRERLGGLGRLEHVLDDVTA